MDRELNGEPFRRQILSEFRVFLLKNKENDEYETRMSMKIKKRDKEREEKKLVDYMEQVDPEAAEAYAEK